jgi:hypothetical protein
MVWGGGTAGVLSRPQVIDEQVLQRKEREEAGRDRLRASLLVENFYSSTKQSFTLIRSRTLRAQEGSDAFALHDLLAATAAAETSVGLLRGAAALTSALHASLLKSGALHPLQHLAASNSLLHAYLQCGLLSPALRLLDETPCRDAATYTSHIRALPPRRAARRVPGLP